MNEKQLKNEQKNDDGFWLFVWAIILIIAMGAIISLTQPPSIEETTAKILADHPECKDQISLDITNERGYSGPNAPSHTQTRFFLVCEAANIRIEVDGQ